MKIAYVEHPVSPKQKKLLRADGYKVMDIRFKPQVIGTDDTVISKESEQKPRMAKKSKK